MSTRLLTVFPRFGILATMKKRADTGRLRSQLATWRQREGLTLAEVAGLVGLSVAMLSLVERGERQLAPLTKVKVARRLGVTVRELFEPEAIEPELVTAGAG
jgi:transcriptional regulator with XRE-family HTH domain